MTRYYLEQPPQDNFIELTGQELHHLKNVQRAKPGDKIWLFDKNGGEYHGQIIEIHKKLARLEIIEIRRGESTGDVKIILAQGLLKSKRWNLLLEKTMELGLWQLRPMICQYLSAGANSAGRSERWQKILIAAAKQCRRNDLYTITPAQSFHEILQESRGIPLRILAHNEKNLPTLKQVLAKYPKKPDKILIMIGAEGGFSEQEITAATEEKMELTQLGSLVLRAETAALALIATLQFYYGE